MTSRRHLSFFCTIIESIGPLKSLCDECGVLQFAILQNFYHKTKKKKVLIQYTLVCAPIGFLVSGRGQSPGVTLHDDGVLVAVWRQSGCVPHLLVT